MREIVGAKIGTFITNAPKKIMLAVETNAQVEWLDRMHMKMMAAMDLGPSWEKMASGPTLFCIGDNDELLPPEAAIRTQPRSK